jgi:hypothetical protein
MSNKYGKLVGREGCFAFRENKKVEARRQEKARRISGKRTANL